MEDVVLAVTINWIRLDLKTKYPWAQSSDRQPKRFPKNFTSEILSLLMITRTFLLCFKGIPGERLTPFPNVIGPRRSRDHKIRITRILTYFNSNRPKICQSLYELSKHLNSSSRKIEVSHLCLCTGEVVTACTNARRFQKLVNPMSDS